MATAKSSSSRSGPNSRGSDPHADKRLTSGRISADISDFVKSGGKVEILGITRDWYKPSAPSARGNKSGKVAPTPAAGVKAPPAKVPAAKTAVTKAAADKVAPAKTAVTKAAAKSPGKPTARKATSKAAAPKKAGAAPRKRSVAKQAKA